VWRRFIFDLRYTIYERVDLRCNQVGRMRIENRIGGIAGFKYVRRMKAKDYFALAVRILGLIFLYHGVMMIPALFTFTLMALITVALFLAVAWWLIGGAPPLVEHAYPASAESKPDETGEKPTEE
jgi:hypothetical protein